MSWINLEDQLPEFGVTVLVANGENVQLAQLNQKRTIENLVCASLLLDWHEANTYVDLFFEPTHWMPLPLLITE